MPQFRMLAKSAGQEPMMRHSDHYEKPGSYQFNSYTKPCAVLHQLCGMVGREQVLAALREYGVAWTGKHPLPWDFFASMNRSLGQDLDWYWRTWCYETWQLDQSVADVKEENRETVVTIEDLGLAPHPSLVRATWNDGHTEDRTVPVTHWLQGNRRATVKFGAGAEKVEIDPEHTSLDVDPKNNVWAR
jgi:aminopeptidase N